MTDIIQDLLRWREETESSLRNLRRQRDHISRQISILEEKAETISNLMRIEKERRPALPGLESTLELENNERRQIDNAALAEDSDTDDDGSRRYVTRRWTNFVRDYIDTYGPATIEELFRRAPEELQLDFKRIPSKYSSIFRARRILRRDENFRVDRQSGLVALSAPDVWPTPPSPAEPPEDPLIIRSATPNPEGFYDIELCRESDPQTNFSIPFPQLYELLCNGTVAYVKDDHGAEEQIAAFHAGNTARIVSFSNGKWTDTFDKVTRNL